MLGGTRILGIAPVVLLLLLLAFVVVLAEFEAARNVDGNGLGNVVLPLLMRICWSRGNAAE